MCIYLLSWEQFKPDCTTNKQAIIYTWWLACLDKAPKACHVSIQPTFVQIRFKYGPRSPGYLASKEEVIAMHWPCEGGEYIIMQFIRAQGTCVEQVAGYQEGTALRLYSAGNDKSYKTSISSEIGIGPIQCKMIDRLKVLMTMSQIQKDLYGIWVDLFIVPGVHTCTVCRAAKCISSWFMRHHQGTANGLIWQTGGEFVSQLLGHDLVVLCWIIWMFALKFNYQFNNVEVILPDQCQWGTQTSILPKLKERRQ